MEQMIVVFRKEKEGGIVAVFPCEVANRLSPQVVGCYSHVGQHSQGDMDYFREKTIPATEEEYNALYDELKQIYEENKFDEPIKLVVKKYFHSSMNQKRYKAWRGNNV